MKKQLYYLLILSFIFLKCSEGSKSNHHVLELDLMLNEITEIYNKGEIKKAIYKLDKIIDDYPNNIQLLVERGIYLFEINEVQQSLRDFKKILNLDKDNTLALFNIGVIYSSIGEKEKSIFYFNKAISTKGGETVWFEDNERSIYKNNYDISMNEIIYQRGLSYYDINSFVSAFKDIDYCVKNQYRLDQSYYYRGIIYLTYKKKDQGCGDLHLSVSYGNNLADSVIKEYCLK